MNAGLTDAKRAVAAPERGGYVMEGDVAAQVVRCQTLPRARLVAAASATGDAALREETLVHFIRAVRRSEDHKAAADLIDILTRRMSGRLSRMARVWRLGYPPDLAEDVIDEILTDVYDQVLSNDPAAEFWEIRFWVCLNRRALNILRRRRKELDQIVSDESDDVDFPECEPLPADFDRRRAGIENPEVRAVIDDALVRLPQPLRTAFLLKHWSGFAEEPGVGGGPAISTMMGVSGRTVRNYLAKAEQRLAEWRAEDDQDG